MKIGEVAKAAGVTTSTIRYYEAVGIMPPVPRKNGVRHYDALAVDDLRILRFYRKSGIPIRGLASVVKHERGSTARRDAYVDVLQARIADLEQWMKEAEHTREMLEEAIVCRCGGKRDRCIALQLANAQR